MARCDECGDEVNMPYHCRHCGGTYCSEHRLPENHDCPGLEDWGDPDGVFDSGFDDSVSTGSTTQSDSVSDRLGISTGPGSVFGYFRGNMTYVFLGVMWITFLLQTVLIAAGFPELQRTLFVLTPQNPEFVWTWFTSIFAHGGFGHIAINSIVVFFFGRVVEDYIGTREFTGLFLASGAIAGLGQILLQIQQGFAAVPGAGGVVGASGAALAVMGVLTILNPNLTVMLYFLFPVPIWVLTIGFTLINILGAFGVQTAVSGGNTAFVAHLVGLAIGLGFGQYVKDKVRRPKQLEFGGGPGGPGGGMGGGRRRGPF